MRWIRAGHGRTCRTRTYLGGALAAGLIALPAAAPAGEREGPDEDVVSIVALERRVLAVNPVTGPVAEVDLDLGESVVSFRTRGRVGVAVTNRRLLGITSRSAIWAELRLRVSESTEVPELRVEERIALVRVGRRVAALGAAAPVWHDFELARDEEVREIVSSARVAALVTDRRAIAFAPRSGFVAEPLAPGERLERAAADDRSVQLVTSSRILVFQSGAARWTWVRD